MPSSVVHADCEPVLVDVADNYRINMDDFEAKLDDTISAIMISHMRGHTSDMDAIMKLAEARGIPVVEDAAPPATGAKLLDSGRLLNID